MPRPNQQKLFSVKNKVIIITGGAGFLGMEYAAFLSRAGGRVVIFDVVAQDVLRSRANKIFKATGKRPLAMSVDITNPKEVKRAVAAVVKDLKQVDVLINNAAMNPSPGSPESSQQFLPYESYPVELWRKELEVSITGSFIVTRAVIPVMKRQRKGVIINIGSIYGLAAPDNRIYGQGKFKSIAYATVEGAVLNFTRALASYLGRFGVRVNCLTLGGVWNNQPLDFVKKYSNRTMLGRMAAKRDFNGAILFLASDASGYMTGANLVMDGGWIAW